MGLRFGVMGCRGRVLGGREAREAGGELGKSSRGQETERQTNTGSLRFIMSLEIPAYV